VPTAKNAQWEGWLTLEKTCTEYARDYNVVWIYTGPIYGEYKRPFAPSRKVPKPIAFYKIVISPGENNGVDVLAFRMPHKAIPRDVDVSEYLVTVRDIENETVLDFLRELPDDLENLLETSVWELSRLGRIQGRIDLSTTVGGPRL